MAGLSEREWTVLNALWASGRATLGGADRGAAYGHRLEQEHGADLSEPHGSEGSGDHRQRRCPPYLPGGPRQVILPGPGEAQFSPPGLPGRGRGSGGCFFEGGTDFPGRTRKTAEAAGRNGFPDLRDRRKQAQLRYDAKAPRVVHRPNPHRPVCPLHRSPGRQGRHLPCRSLLCTSAAGWYKYFCSQPFHWPSICRGVLCELLLSSPCSSSAVSSASA